MPYAGYLLNPGDMFQVEPDSVLFATGQPKSEIQISEGKLVRRERSKVWRRLGKLWVTPANPFRRPAPVAPKAIEEVKEDAEGEESDELAVVADVPGLQSVRAVEIVREERKRALDELLFKNQVFFDKGKRWLGAKRKQETRAFIKEVKDVRKNINKMSEKELEGEILRLVEKSVMIRRIGRKAVDNEKIDAERSHPSVYKDKAAKKVYRELLNMEKDGEKIDDNPVDAQKPYATPWAPRDYMSPFAFIPRYLEVNQSICSAVYLRHPVARPGLSEVPSPFHAETQQLAFNWYLRRR